jgi:hypothetical protein
VIFPAADADEGIKMKAKGNKNIKEKYYVTMLKKYP